MKRNKKTLLTLALATMFVGAGAGAIAAIDTVNEPTAITASAENPAIDMASTISVKNWGAVGDFKDTPLYRIALTAGDANAWEFGYFPVKNSDTEILNWIYVNGKSVAQHAAEYKAAVEAGERNHVTSLCNELGNDPVNYAPIFVKILHHPSLSAKCLDIYIPSDYLAAHEVFSITIKKDFSTENLETVAGKVTTNQEYYLSKDVALKVKPNNSYVNSEGNHYYGTIVPDLEEVPVNVTEVKWYGTGEQRNWFGLTLDGHNFPGSGNNEANKDYADALNLYEYIYVDGVSLASYCLQDSSQTTEAYFTGSGHHGADVLSFRTPSHFNATKIAEAKEIVIKAGCQLPMYNSTTECFVVEEDVVFKKFNGAFAATDEEISEMSAASRLEDGVVKIALTLPEFAVCPTTINEWDYNYGAYIPMREHILLGVFGEFYPIDEINAAAADEGITDFEGMPFPYGVNDLPEFKKCILVHNVPGSNVFELLIDPRVIELFGTDSFDVKLAAGFTMGVKLVADGNVIKAEPTGFVFEEVVVEGVSVLPCTITIDGVETGAMVGATIAKPSAVESYEEAGYLYTLEGWKTADGYLWNFEEDVAEDGLVLTKSYAKEAIEYTISFNHPKSGMPLAAPINFTVETIDDVVEFPAVPEDLAREGYTVAWNKTVADVTLADLQVTPVWTAITYTATFVADGETVGTVNYTVEDTEITAPAVPEKPGYTGAWNAYELAIGGVTVNASYSVITYTVTFVVDGETVGTATYTVENTEITAPDVPAKDGYTAAWEAYELTIGDVTVNAAYTAITYTATFMADGETVGTVNYTVEDSAIEAPAVPEKAGYAGAWNAYELAIGGVTVNASYSVITYTVTFVADGETVGTATYTVENTEITAPDVPAKDGYTGAWEAYELTTGDVTVNAVYTAIPVEEEEGGCGSVIGGVSAAVAMLGAAVVVLKKKKED